MGKEIFEDSPALVPASSSCRLGRYHRRGSSEKIMNDVVIPSDT